MLIRVRARVACLSAFAHAWPRALAMEQRDWERRRRRFIIGLYATVLSCFGIGALRVLIQPYLPAVPVPQPPAYDFSSPLTLEMRFVAEQASTLEALAPRALRAAVARALRAGLRSRADAACSHAWRVRISTALRPAMGEGSLLLEQPLWDGRREQRRVRVTLMLRHARSSTCGDALHPLVASSSAHVAACMLNGTDGGLLAQLSTLLREELSERACTLARDPHAWRPPARVSLLMLHRHARPSTAEEAARDAASRRSRSMQLDDLRGEIQSLLESTWPAMPPPVHSDMLLIGGGRNEPTKTLDEAAAAEMIEACASGGKGCGNGLPPSLGSEPPLRLLLYAHAPRESPPRVLDRRGKPLRTGTGFVLPPSGALLPWRDDDESAACDDQGMDGPPMRAGLFAQLRVLMGLPDTPSARLAASTGTDARSHPAMHWLEMEAVQQACVRAYIDRAETDLRMLPTYTRAAPEYDIDAVHAHAVAAWAHVLNSSRHAARGEIDLACAHAARASRRALEAVRHPSLLAISELPDNYWMSTWPPLFFPIATAVGSALFTEIKEARREARRARASA